MKYSEPTGGQTAILSAQLHRRSILKLGCLTALATPVAGAWAVSPLHAYRLEAEACKTFRKGDVLLVDTGNRVYRGDGLYLYPDWGQPRPYLITAGAGRVLAFRDPDTARILWEDRFSDTPQFAGTVVFHVASGSYPAVEGFARLDIKTHPDIA